MRKEPAYDTYDTHAYPFVQMSTIHKVISDPLGSRMSNGERSYGELETANPCYSVLKNVAL